ncbi:MAG: hypothetical protein KAX16_05960, partial [Actinomycetia bacterium]|nr:hypothetical protein [Actinomycetes bacterium]
MHLKLISRNYLIAFLVSAMIGLLLILPGTSSAILNIINEDSNPRAISLEQPGYVQDQVLVKFKDSASLMDRRQIKSRVGVERRLRKVPSSKKPRAGSIYLYKLKPGQSITKALAKIRADKNVLSAQPNYIRKLSLTPNDPSFSSQWGLNNTGQSGGMPDADIDAPEGWDIENGTSNQVTIAVIDS